MPSRRHLLAAAPALALVLAGCATGPVGCRARHLGDRGGRRPTPRPTP